jgi:hypothetical protein
MDQVPLQRRQRLPRDVTSPGDREERGVQQRNEQRARQGDEQVEKAVVLEQ